MPISRILLALLILGVALAASPLVAPQLFQGTLAAFDQEFFSILVNGHNMRANGYVPLRTPVSTSSVLLVGEDTPDNAHCVGCTPWNQENGTTISMRQMNTVTPMVGLSILTNPGVDGFNGIWGLNVSTSNAFHSNASGSGILGAEINIGLDDFATDIPNPGNLGQSIGVTVTESSQNKTGKRVSTAYGIGSAGPQNFHHGLWVGASSSAQSPMDDLIHASGPINKAIDLSQVASGPIAAEMPANGGFRYGNVEDNSKLPLGTAPGTAYWCLHCARNTEPCGYGTQQALAISTGSAYRCQ